MYIDFTHQNGHQGLNSQNVSYYNVDLVLFQPHDEPLSISQWLGFKRQFLKLC